MDPLSIVSLTDNVAQFISIGYRILFIAQKFYKSPKNSVDELQAIGWLAEDANRSIGVIFRDFPLVVRTRADKDLQDISIECGQLGAKLLAQTENLRRDNERLQRKLRALLIPAALWFKKRELHGILTRLIVLEARLRGWWFPTPICQLDLTGENHAIYAIKTDLNQLKSRASGLDISQFLLPSLNNGLDRIMYNITFLEDDSIMYSRRAETEGNDLKFHTYDEETSRTKRHHRVLRSLIFDSIWTRRDNIEVAHTGTLEWVFDSPIINFCTWLETGSGVYWINGLAGSGKSTAMKFISSHAATMKALKKWAGGKEVVIASHYFWIAGTKMQKSLEGLLQALLFQVLRKSPLLINALFPQQDHFRRTRSLSELKALVNELQVEELGYCFCFFIDGLDEYHGAKEDITRVVTDLAACPWIKICASSRPKSAFLAEWNSNPFSFHMQGFTRNDISAYVHDKVGIDHRFQVASKDDPRWLRLTQTMVYKAEGIWIWVYFVVHELLRDIKDGAPFQHLQNQIDSYPTELGALFDCIINRIDRVHTTSAARLMLSSTAAMRPLSILALVALEEEEDFVIQTEIYRLSETQLVELYEDWQPRLQNRYRGLMKLEKTTRGHATNFQVGFVHRTVKEFLLEEHQDGLQTKAGAGFDARLFLCQVKLMEFKRAEHDYNASLHIFHFTELIWYAKMMEQEPVETQDHQVLIDLLHELERAMRYHSRLYRAQ